MGTRAELGESAGLPEQREGITLADKSRTNPELVVVVQLQQANIYIIMLRLI